MAKEPQSSKEPATTWLNTAKSAEYLSASIPSIRRWIKAGKLKPGRTPGGGLRFRRSDLDALLTE
jgi:excisionase family DNA binding protein